MGFEPVFAFLDDHHFVIPSILSERPGEIVLDVYPLFPQLGQQQAPAIIRSYVLFLPDVEIYSLCLLFGPRRQRTWRCVPGPLLREPLKAHVRHPDRGHHPVDE